MRQIRALDDVEDQTTCGIKRSKHMKWLAFHVEVSTPGAVVHATIQVIYTLAISGSSKYPPEKR
jgi:hypothetical protein